MSWHDYSPWLPVLGVALAAVGVAVVAHFIWRAIVFRLARLSPLLDVVVHQCERAALFLVPLVVLQIVWQGAPEDLPSIQGVRHATGLLIIAVATWLLFSAVKGLAEGVIKLHPADVENNLQARRIHTQTRVLSRIAMGGVLVAGVSFGLMTFPGARQLGASLLASAGVVGLVAGIAARPVFGNLIAGLQIALSQPLRIDDVLIVEGEWGRVEEITGTYVVLRIWDERRLIIPLQWFVEHPFQNWTRTSAQLLGTVFLWVDYTLGLEPLRAEAQRLCETSPKWDRRVCVVQVTDTNEHAMQLRILVSSGSSGDNFDLRCTVREGLIAFIQREQPHALPRMRTELHRDPIKDVPPPQPLPPVDASTGASSPSP
jgi:small-conductance mechanosensitive channel